MRGSLSHYANQAVKEIFMKIIMLENEGCYTNYAIDLKITHSGRKPTLQHEDQIRGLYICSFVINIRDCTQML